MRSSSLTRFNKPIFRGFVDGLCLWRSPAACGAAGALGAGESAALRQALDEGLSVLQAGGSDARQQLLAADATVALASPGAAQLWACCLEACEEGEVASVEALATAITSGCAAVAGLLFANAFGV